MQSCSCGIVRGAGVEREAAGSVGHNVNTSQDMGLFIYSPFGLICFIFFIDSLFCYEMCINLILREKYYLYTDDLYQYHFPQYVNMYLLSSFPPESPWINDLLSAPYLFS